MNGTRRMQKETACCPTGMTRRPVHGGQKEQSLLLSKAQRAASLVQTNIDDHFALKGPEEAEDDSRERVEPIVID